MGREEAEADETLSLSEFPLNTDHLCSVEDHQPHIFNFDFEFFTGNFSPRRRVSAAEDIIFFGQLVPFKDPSSSSSSPPRTPLLLASSRFGADDDSCRRSGESLSESGTAPTHTPDPRFARNCRSLHSHRTRPLLSTPRCRSFPLSVPESIRNSPGKSAGNEPEPVVRNKVPKLPWLTMGLVRIPPEMELSDVWSRQIRRNPTALFPPVEHAVHRDSASGSVLGALSCRDDADVGVTAPFGCTRPVCSSRGALAKAPLDMELSDSKSRQIRRNPTVGTGRHGGRKGPGFGFVLGALRCRTNADVAVATPFVARTKSNHVTQRSRSREGPNIEIS